MSEEVDEEVIDDDALAAEWESSVAGEDEDADAAGTTGTRVLDQDEIDSLLGFGGSDGPGGNRRFPLRRQCVGGTERKNINKNNTLKILRLTDC